MLHSFDSFTYHHLFNAEANPANALTVMKERGALFDVVYPASGYESEFSIFPGQGMNTPAVESGVNKGKPLHKYVIREDTGDVLGLHSHSYAETKSYRFLGDTAEALFPNSATSCTVFGKGEKVALTQHIVEPTDLGDGDVIQPSLCWITSFNGRWKTSVYDLVERLFCQNQLVGRTPLVGVKHTRNHDSLLEMRVNVLEAAIARADALKRMALALKDQSFTDAQFTGLMLQLVPKPDDDAHGKTVNLYEHKTSACGRRWRDERKEFGAGNRWMAYNAIQGAEQHEINGRVRGHVSRDRALEKAIDNQTPLADKALILLTV